MQAQIPRATARVRSDVLRAERSNAMQRATWGSLDASGPGSFVLAGRCRAAQSRKLRDPSCATTDVPWRMHGHPKLPSQVDRS